MRYLETIIARKREEIARLILPQKSTSALKQQRLSVIAEIKRKSPSKGQLASILDPVALARSYLAAGANALSVLTDGPDFGGSLQDLKAVSEAFPHIPLLRKDFILDVAQLKETVRAGATLVLLIAAALKEKLSEMIQASYAYDLEPLVEVHDAEELELALRAGAQIIGVNNRNLNTFHVDLSIAERLSAEIPPSCLKIAESGIRTKADAQRMRRAGYDAVLVGEALVLAEDPRRLIQEFQQC